MLRVYLLPQIKRHQGVGLDTEEHAILDACVTCVSTPSNKAPPGCWS